jgi:hypothetical protein
MSGWIKLHRVLAGSAIGNKPDYLAVWVHLLLSAAHRSREILVGRQIVKLEAGQLVFGRKAFSAKTGVSEAVIRSSLDAFKSLKQITIKTTTKYSIISITKWAEYQSEEPANSLKKTNKQPAVNHKQEGKELQEGRSKSSAADESDGEESDGGGETSRGGRAPSIPYGKIFDLYAEILPTLPQVSIRDERRKTMIRARWRTDERFQTIEFWQGYFEYIKKTSFLMGMHCASFDWFMKPSNFAKVIEGNYE